MKIRPLRAELLHAEKTDRQKWRS